MTVRTRLQLRCGKTSVLDRMLGRPAVESSWELKSKYLDFLLFFFFLDLGRDFCCFLHVSDCPSS